MIGQNTGRGAFLPLIALALLLAVLPLLLAAGEGGGEMDIAGMECIECHEDLTVGEVVHSPVEDQSCDMCHEQDGERHAFTLPDPVSEACFNCHDDPGAGGGYVHGPVAAGQCTECHSPHHSENASLLLKPSPELCWKCHGRSVQRDGGRRPLENIRKTVMEAQVPHDAVEAGCDTCHPAHAAEGKRLFSGAFPDGPYARDYKNDYGLCFDCHDSEMVFDPANQDTGFRDGTMNLHAKHVAREKSRSCAICHSPHGGGEHILRKDAAFGGWRLPIGWTATDSGGQCATACHEKRDYINIDLPAAAGN